ncbi:signal peptide peptidase SppA [Candidatus Woesearchaeota archaeon]|nr:signal peptide peptidase SppA [Candidatus Woesearchaeota archaeon]
MMNQNLKVGILIAAVLVIISFLITLMLTSDYSSGLSLPSESTARVAVIDVSGPIETETSGSLFAEPAPNSEQIAGLIKDANEDDDIDAVMININSPGGTIVASQEISDAVKELEKPSVAYIKELGASGGYWVASASDYIITDKYAITGSIGVIGSYLSFGGFLERYNVSYERLVGGKYKDIGTPFKDLTNEERAILQSKIDYLHSAFVQEVAVNRNMSYEYVQNLATGMFYLGQEAYDLGLVDELGNKETVEEYLKELLGVEEIRFISYNRQPSLLEAFTKLMSKSFFNVGLGISDGLLKAEAFPVLRA